MLSGSGAASNHGGSETLELENVFKMFDSWWNGLLEYDSSKSCDTIPWLYVALCKNISLTRVY